MASISTPAFLLSFAFAACSSVGSVTSDEAGGGGDEPGGDAGGGGGGARADAGFTEDVAGEPVALMGITNAHNEVRAAHGVAPLEWDDDLAAVARSWAEGCQWGHNDGRSESFPGYVGENIYGASFTPSGLEVTSSWASEEADYDYDSNSCSGVCGHYTQIVWADSTKLGCAIASCPDGQVASFVVCDYSPGGNIGGQRPY